MSDFEYKTATDELVERMQAYKIKGKENQFSMYDLILVNTSRLESRHSDVDNAPSCGLVHLTYLMVEHAETKETCFSCLEYIQKYTEQQIICQIEASENAFLLSDVGLALRADFSVDGCGVI
jgi:hypothetical protein